MTYNKPEVVRLAEAVVSVQGISKDTLPSDNPGVEEFTVAGAYEADE